MKPVSDMRKSYELGELDEADVNNEPLQTFDRWFQEAVKAKLLEPNAMTLATVDANNRPSTRVLLIKSYDDAGLVWFTNYSSRKGLELEHNPYAAIQFHWAELERVVRVEGKVSKISAEESDAYFVTRPLDHRIGAWASPQSQPITSRAVIVSNAAKYAAKFLLSPPRPAHWGGYRLVPDCWEFWQGRKSRLHDRLRYTKNEQGVWQLERLAP